MRYFLQVILHSNLEFMHAVTLLFPKGFFPRVSLKAMPLRVTLSRRNRLFLHFLNSPKTEQTKALDIEHHRNTQLTDFCMNRLQLPLSSAFLN